MKIKIDILILAIIVFVAVVAGLLLHNVLFPPREIVIDTTDWEVIRNWEQIAKHSKIIAHNVSNFRPRLIPGHNDTIIIHDTTQVQNVPVQLYSECHNIPLSVNCDTNYIPVKVEVQYQLIDWIRVSTDPMPYPIKITQKQKAVRFWGYGAVSFNTQKRLSTEIRFGLDIGKHLFACVGSRLDSRLDGIAEAGVGWRL